MEFSSKCFKILFGLVDIKSIKLALYLSLLYFCELNSMTTTWVIYKIHKIKHRYHKSKVGKKSIEVFFFVLSVLLYSLVSEQCYERSGIIDLYKRIQDLIMNFLFVFFHRFIFIGKVLPFFSWANTSFIWLYRRKWKN